MTENQKITSDILFIQRKPYKTCLKSYCKINFIKQSDIARSLNLTKQEFSDFLTGKKNASPSKGVLSYEDFKRSINNELGIDFIDFCNTFIIT